MPAELVLIVEDNARNLELVRDILEVHGFRTLEAASAVRGIELALTHRPNLVLMDIQLPDMDGAAALRLLRADPLTASIPVVALTAFAMKHDRERFMEAGFDGYLVKPVDIRTLPFQVRQFCRASARDEA